MAKKKKKTISENFNLNKNQYELDFFDSYINKDTPLFIDPWAIRCGSDPFSLSCYRKIQSVFEKLVEYIKNNQKELALDLLNNLHEPSETALGYASSSVKGSSIGREKSEKIYDKLKKSNAIKSGLLKDIEDTALHVEGIGPDNISDIITNIIRLDLIHYTQSQCDLYKIETHSTTTKIYWDEQSQDFVHGDEKMLFINGKKILLVPKKILRKKLSINYKDFYEKGIIEFEQSRHFDLRTSLCRTLKNKTLAKPYKKTLEERSEYKLSRELVQKYIENEPSILDEYKKKVEESKTKKISNAEILKKQKKNISINKNVEEKIDKFKEIKTGRLEASVYHNHAFDCLSIIFNEPSSENYLSYPVKEDKSYHDGRKRIDITFYNSSNRGFFSRLSNYGSMTCANILFECKNYADDIENPEYDQMAGRFNNKTSSIGFIVCRDINNKNKSLERCRDIVRDSRGYIIILTDKDIITLLGFVTSKYRDKEINYFLEQKIKEIISI